MCAKFHDHNKQCFMLIVKYKVICILCSHCLRLVLLVTIMSHCNVRLHVCAEFHDHTYTVLFKLSPEAGCYWLRVLKTEMITLD